MADTYMTVTVTLKGKMVAYNSSGESDYKLELDCPAMRSNFPLILYVPTEVGESFDGTPKTLVMHTTTKVKESYKGDIPWHWKWRFVSLADEGVAPTAFTPPSVSGVMSAHEYVEEHGFDVKVKGETVIPTAEPTEPDAYDPMVLPVLRPSADRYSSHSVLYQEWKRDRHLALMTAKDMKRDDWGPYDVLEEAGLYFQWLRQSPLPTQTTAPDGPELGKEGEETFVEEGENS